MLLMTTSLLWWALTSPWNTSTKFSFSSWLLASRSISGGHDLMQLIFFFFLLSFDNLQPCISFRCFIMDDRGYLIAHRSLIEPTGRAPLEQKHITHMVGMLLGFSSEKQFQIVFLLDGRSLWLLMISWTIRALSPRSCAMHTLTEPFRDSIRWYCYSQLLLLHSESSLNSILNSCTLSVQH